ncbi:MAG: inositol monophosphatase family protein [Muribaculaceae bacterium]
MNYDELNTDDLLLHATELARKAGMVQLEYFRSGRLTAENKLNDADIVTAADRASEATVISGIRQRYANHRILSEESGLSQSDSPFEWVIDPLDGTTNFNAGLPLFAVSIGIKHKGETIVGVVYAPYIDELFHAVKGEGAYLNGRRIGVSHCTELSKAVVGTGFPVDKMLTTDNNTDNFVKILPLTRAVRRLGSAAMDICYVALGAFDAFWEINLHEWDVCAALLIAQEAGAESEHFRTDRNVSVVVGTPAIKQQISELLSRRPG